MVVSHSYKAVEKFSMAKPLKPKSAIVHLQHNGVAHQLLLENRRLLPHASQYFAQLLVIKMLPERQNSMLANVKGQRLLKDGGSLSKWNHLRTALCLGRSHIPGMKSLAIFLVMRAQKLRLKGLR